MALLTTPLQITGSHWQHRKNGALSSPEKKARSSAEISCITSNFWARGLSTATCAPDIKTTLKAVEVSHDVILEGSRGMELHQGHKDTATMYLLLWKQGRCHERNTWLVSLTQALNFGSSLTTEFFYLLHLHWEFRKAALFTMTST